MFSALGMVSKLPFDVLSRAVALLGLGDLPPRGGIPEHMSRAIALLHGWYTVALGSKTSVDSENFRITRKGSRVRRDARGDLARLQKELGRRRAWSAAKLHMLWDSIGDSAGGKLVSNLPGRDDFQRFARLQACLDDPKCGPRTLRNAASKALNDFPLLEATEVETDHDVFIMDDERHSPAAYRAMQNALVEREERKARRRRDHVRSGTIARPSHRPVQDDRAEVAKMLIAIWDDVTRAPRGGYVPGNRFYDLCCLLFEAVYGLGANPERPLKRAAARKIPLVTIDSNILGTLEILGRG